MHFSSFIFYQIASKLLVTRTGIKARMSLISGLWFPWSIYMFFEMRFDLGTSDSGERSLPFGLLVRYSFLIVALLCLDSANTGNSTCTGAFTEAC